MPQCKKCGKKGLFLKIEDDTGLCLACNEEFSGQGKRLTQAITESKNQVTRTKDPGEIVKFCQAVESRGRELLDLHGRFGLQPSQELLDLIQTYRKMRELAEKQPSK